MPNDAKLGLVVGVGLVIIVAVVFFRKDLATSTGLVPEKAAVSTYRPTLPSQRPITTPSRPTLAKGKAMSRTEASTDARLAVRRHTVAEGDTLFTLARRYYGDGEKFIDLYKANREVLTSPDALPPGTELVIPNLGNAEKSANESQAGLGEARD